MSESEIVFCVECGHAKPSKPETAWSICGAFDDMQSAKLYYDEIDLMFCYSRFIRKHPDEFDHVFKKMCYVAERDEHGRLKPLSYLDRADYDHGAYTIDSLKGLGLRW